MDEFTRKSLGAATAQICQSLGWHSIHRSSHDILTEVLERYLKKLATKTTSISNTCKLVEGFMVIIADGPQHFMSTGSWNFDVFLSPPPTRFSNSTHP